MLYGGDNVMITRLVMFNCVVSLLSFSAASGAFMIRVHPKPNRFEFMNRINRYAMKTMPWLLAVVAALALIIAVVVGKEILVSSGERAFSVALAAVWLLISLASIWRNLRAPKMSWAEYRKHRMFKVLARHIAGMLLILACGVAAWFHGRNTGLRALSEAAVEAREIIESRQKEGSPEAAAAYVVLFKELDADKGLGHVWERTGQEAALPEGEHLAELVRERRELIKRIEKFSSGPAPAFGLRHLGTGPEPGRGVYGGFKKAARLLTLASRQAAAEGNGARALALCRVRLRLAEHLGHIPGWLAWIVSNRDSRPDLETFGVCLTAATKAERAALTAYAWELAERRRAAGKTLAVAMLEDTASRLIWQQEIVTGPTSADEDGRGLSQGLYWRILPYYGEESVPGILPRARRFSQALILREEEARAEARRLDKEAEAQPSFVALCLTFDAFLSHERPVNSRVGAEKSLARYEAACALRLHALDNDKYPEKLSELAPKHLDAAVLDMVQKAKTKYERTKTGCRLYWPVRSCDAKKTTEIILGPRPPAKKKPAMKPDVNYTPRAKPTGH